MKRKAIIEGEEAERGSMVMIYEKVPAQASTGKGQTDVEGDGLQAPDEEGPRDIILAKRNGT